MNVVVLAPINSSLYALLVTHLCLQEEGMDISGIILRRIYNLNRLRSEFRRDGYRLVRKICQKLILANKHEIPGEETLHTHAQRLGLETRSLTQLAKLNRIPLIRVNDLNSKESIEFLKKATPEVVAFTGGGIIRQNLLDVSGKGILNVHMGILPPYRGMDVVEWPILEQQYHNLGITLHFMDRGVDTGAILEVKHIPIKANDTIRHIRTRHEIAMCDLMVWGIRNVTLNNIETRSQSHRAGKQFFVMHPRLVEAARGRLQEFAPEQTQ